MGLQGRQSCTLTPVYWQHELWRAAAFSSVAVQVLCLKPRTLDEVGMAVLAVVLG